MYYPDGTQCTWDELDKLQRVFLKFFNKERTKALLTFPVTTVTLYNNGKEILDKEYEEFITDELSHGNSFFIYTSDSIDSLSSCCFEGSEKILVTNKDNKTEYISIRDYVNKYSLGEEIDSKYDTGDYILSYDHYTEYFVPTKITGILKKRYDYRVIYMKVGRNVLTVTPDHKFMVRDINTHVIDELSASELVSTYNLYEILTSVDNGYKYKEITNMHWCSLEEPYVYDIELEENHYFFANSILTHNCRLRNGIADQLNDFSYSLGAGGIMTGSMNVLTLNMNRFIQSSFKSYMKYAACEKSVDHFIHNYFTSSLIEQIKNMHKFQIGFKLLFKQLEKDNMLPAYTAHYIDLDKQYLTIGINGLMEGLEYLGYKPSNNREYKEVLAYILKIISNTNKETIDRYSELKLKINCEVVPAEGLGVKFAKWDKKDGYAVPRDCYNSYFYPVEDDTISIIDKFDIHGGNVAKSIDGGFAVHANLAETPTKETFKHLLNAAVNTGCNYFCFNVKVTCCNDCGYIDKRTLNHCSKCGSKNIDYASRVIGYLRKISNYSKERQLEEKKRAYIRC